MKKISTALVVLTLTCLFCVSASAKTVLKGDFDMNGRITAMDARSILRVGAKIDECTADQLTISDMNNDGRITAMDARTVLRISAKIDTSDETVEIGSETTTEDNNDNIERKELSGGFSMTADDFMKKYGGMRKVDTNDGTTRYTNDYVTIIHDPDMIYSGCINSISITGGKYMLCGVYTGMSDTTAISTLKAANWKISSQSDTQVILEQNAMRMKLAVDGGKVTFAEYYLGFSLVNPDMDKETTTKEPEITTKEPEITTQPPETTTQPPETTTKEPETTTKEPEQTTSSSDIPSGNDVFNSLPEQIKAYLIGEFAFEGFRYEKEQKTPVKMTFANGNVMASMSDEMNDGSTMTLEMLIDNSGKKPKLYFLNSTNMKYTELNSLLMAALGIDANMIDVGYSAVDINKIDAESKEGKLNGANCMIYKIYTGTETCDIYMIGDEIKKIVNYDSVGNIKSQMDITTFRFVTKDDATLKNYKQGSMLEVIGVSISDILGGK